MVDLPVLMRYNEGTAIEVPAALQTPWDRVIRGNLTTMNDSNPDPLQKQCPTCDEQIRVPVRAALDTALSFDARGLLFYLYSLDGDTLKWSDLKQGCGRDKLYELVDELEAAGYLQRKQERGARGTLGRCTFILHDEPRAPSAGPDTGYVYLIQPTGHNVFKIGCTTDVTKRLASLQSKMDARLLVIHAFACHDHEATERRLHRRYKRFHLDGDWFALPEWAVAEIKGM